MGVLKPRIAIPIPTTADQPYNQRSWKQYAQAVFAAGGEPLQLPLTPDRRALTDLVNGCEGVCLPGSPADIDPARYGAEREEATAPSDEARETVDFFLLDWASRQAKPVLGICFGLQSLNVWSGGTLVQDLSALPVNHSAGSSVAVAHSVLVPPGSGLAALLKAEEAPVSRDFLRLPINSSHHQAVASPGTGLRIVARCPDDGVIEALETDPVKSTSVQASTLPPWLLGVQWHPERSTSISGTSRALFRSLVTEALRASERDASRPE